MDENPDLDVTRYAGQPAKRPQPNALRSRERQGPPKPTPANVLRPRC